MKLRLGQLVNATDGPVGQLGQIVVDPRAQTVTHIVVEPILRHYQARLVPIWLVTDDDDTLTVQLDIEHLRRLERVSFSDHVSAGESVDVGDKWDIGTEDVVLSPYLDMEHDMVWADDAFGVTYERVPKGECEVRRSSDVVTSEGSVVGDVAGLLADEDHVTAIVVTTGLPGFHHDVLVPLGSLAKVRNDRIELTITKDQFDDLPHTDTFGEPEELKTHIADLQQRAEQVRKKIRSSGKNLVASAKTRIHETRTKL